MFQKKKKKAASLQKKVSTEVELFINNYIMILSCYNIYLRQEVNLKVKLTLKVMELHEIFKIGPKCWNLQVITFWWGGVYAGRFVSL